MKYVSTLFQVLLLALLSGFSSLSHSEDVNVAVAANFTAPMEKIAQAFAKDTGHKAILSFGSTGALYAQISNGAPFALLLAADESTPQRLETEQVAVAGSSFTYATGKLVLWSPSATKVDSAGQVLASGNFNRLAIANPDTAPYGKAAIEVLGRLQLLESLRSKMVTGNNIAQTFQFVSSGNAEVGFIALSQVYLNGKIQNGSAWIIPAENYTPIRQNAVLLKSGAQNPAAKALLEYLRSPAATAIIESYGYAL